MVPLCSMMFQLHHVNTKWLNVSIERKLKDIGIQTGVLRFIILSVSTIENSKVNAALKIILNLWMKGQVFT